MRTCLILLISLFLGCASPTWMSIGGDAMYHKYDRNFTIEQFDSICTNDTLPLDFKKWKTIPLLDEEDRTQIKRYLYIKRGLPEQIYVATDKDSIIQVNKRVAL